MTPETDGITFEVERIVLVADRLEVSGRWFGVRGRRFMRPTLILRVGPDAGEQRVLADLEHKPWAAQDGEDWMAAFPVFAEPEAATEIELAVAPDITVQLASGDGAPMPGTRKRPKTVAAATQARAPRVRADLVGGRPRERSAEAERLRERLTAAEQNTERERAKRKTVEQALEEERRGARQLRAELGRVRAELELAGAVQRELATATAALDALRSQLRDAARERETPEREQAPREPAPRERAPREQPRERAPRERAPVPVPPRTERPLNPSLRSGSWLIRGLAVVVMLIVIVAIVLVIRSTVG